MAREAFLGSTTVTWSDQTGRVERLDLAGTAEGRLILVARALAFKLSGSSL
jgi:hypothetical protein